jgi:hypothetical protein
MATIYAAYFALHVVGNTRGQGDLWWGRVVSLSMAVVAVTAPFLGSLADRADLRRALFIGFTALSVAATGLMATVEPGMVAWGVLLAVAGNVGFESARSSTTTPGSRSSRRLAARAGSPRGALPLATARSSRCWSPCRSSAPAPSTARSSSRRRCSVALPCLRSCGCHPPRAPACRSGALRDGVADVTAGLRTILAHPQL